MSVYGLLFYSLSLNLIHWMTTLWITILESTKLVTECGYFHNCDKTHSFFSSSSFFTVRKERCNQRSAQLYQTLSTKKTVFLCSLAANSATLSRFTQTAPTRIAVCFSTSNTLNRKNTCTTTTMTMVKQLTPISTTWVNNSQFQRSFDRRITLYQRGVVSAQLTTSQFHRPRTQPFANIKTRFHQCSKGIRSKLDNLLRRQPTTRS